MKKTLSLLSLMASLSILPLISCNKKVNDSNLDVSPATKSSNAKALDIARQINAEFKGSKQGPNTLASNVQVGVTVGADLVAGGLALKSTAAWWAIGPVGAWGSGLVSACCAAGASISAYHGMAKAAIVRNGGTPPQTWFDDYNTAAAKLENYAVVAERNPFSNPFDSVGIRHNQYVKLYYTSQNYYLPDSTFYLINPVNLPSEEAAAIQSFPVNIPLYNSIDYGFINPMLDSASLMAFANHGYGQVGTNTFLQNFTNMFLNGVLSCRTYKDVVSLAHAYEQQYVTFSGFDDFERRYVLSIIATAKYSALLWEQVNS